MQKNNNNELKKLCNLCFVINWRFGWLTALVDGCKLKLLTSEIKEAQPPLIYNGSHKNSGDNNARKLIKEIQ